MIKRRVAFILAVLTIISTLGFFAAASAAAATLTVDGVRVSATVRTKSGQSLFPIRLICEALSSKGYSYAYKSGKATIDTPDDTYKMTKGSKTYYYDNGQERMSLSVAPALYSNMLYVPETFYTDMLGMTYTKDSSGNHVLKTTAATAVTATPAPNVPATLAPIATAALGNIYLNEKQLSGSAYLNAGGYLMVPLQPIVAAYSGTIGQSGTTYIIVVNGTYIYIDPAQTMFNYNGQQLTMVAKPELINGQLNVPISFIEKVFSATYTYLNGTLKLQTSAGIAQSEYYMRLNGTILSVKGYTNISGKIMLPIKTVGEALGYSVSATSGVVSVTKGTQTISFTPGQTSYRVNWGSKTYPASETRNSDVFVPVEFFQEELGLASATITNGEIVLTTTGVATGGIAIKVNRSGSYVATGLYGKASANGKTVLVPINELAADFGYQSYTVSGNFIHLTKSDGNKTEQANIQLSTDSTNYLLSQSSHTNRTGWKISDGKPEMSGMTLYVPIDMLREATGIQYSGDPTTGLVIG